MTTTLPPDKNNNKEWGIDKELKRLHDVTGLALDVMIGFS
jgi:hypothetical protein